MARSNHDKRRHPRAQVDMDVRVIDTHSRLDKKDINISESGMYFESNIEYQVGSTIPIVLREYPSDQLLLLKGEVVRAYRRENSDMIGVAVQFIEVPPRERERLRNIVRSASGDEPIIRLFIKDSNLNDLVKAVLEKRRYRVASEFDKDRTNLNQERNADMVVAVLGSTENTLDQARRSGGNLPMIIICEDPADILKQDAQSWGPYEIIKRPLDPERLISVVSRLLHASRLEMRGTPSQLMGTPNLIAQSKPMLEVVEEMMELARVEATVLITGETGAGKDWLAMEMHRISKRCKHEFVRVDCASLQTSMASSDLFGHIKGSFTDAKTNRTGYLERARDGVLFLDEVGDLSPENQLMLLRFLGTGTYEKVGGDTEFKSNAWVIAATNRHLRDMVEQGLFREDLYYRLQVHEIVVPPLRERKEDLVPLAMELLEELNERYKKSVEIFGPKAFEQLIGYDWPGNVRQLRHVLSASLLKTKGNTLNTLRIDPAPTNTRQAPKASEPTPQSVDLEQPWRDYRKKMLSFAEKKYIQYHLERSKGKVALAAKNAGISRQKFAEKAKKLGIKRTEYKGPNDG